MSISSSMKHDGIACPCKSTLCLIQLLQPSLVVAIQSLNQRSPENQQCFFFISLRSGVSDDKSYWTMGKQGANCVYINSLTAMMQITAVFTGTLMGNFFHHRSSWWGVGGPCCQ